MVGFAVGLGSFATGMQQGMQLGQQIKGALDDRKLRKIRKEGTAEATAAREKDIAGAITTTAGPDGAQSYTVGDKSFASIDEAKALATKQVGSVMQYYRDHTVPKLIEGYMQVDRPEQASQLQTWMDSQHARDVTKDWAHAARLGMIGDTKGAMKGFGKLYERLEPGFKYVGTEDITEPVYEDIKDKTGAVTGRKEVGTRPVGMRLKLKNADGEEVSHDFSGSEDMFRTAMFTLSPDKFAERAFGEVDRAEASRAAAAKAERDYRADIGKETYKSTLTDQRDDRQFRREVMKGDREFAQQSTRDATQAGYRMDETLSAIQLRAALKIGEETGEKPEDVRKSLETIAKRLAETDSKFKEKTSEQQTAQAVGILQQQRAAARGVMESTGASGGRDREKGAIPRLW